MAKSRLAPAPVVEPKETASRSGRLAGLAGSWDLALRFGLLGIIVVLAIFFTVAASGFATIGNAQNIGRQMAVTGVIAVGETFVIITAGIDLSVGSLLGLAGVVAGIELLHGWPLALAVLTPLLLGLLIGLFNGALVDAAKLPPFIVTLGMLGILRGLAIIGGAGQQIALGSSPLTDFAQNTVFGPNGIPNLFLVLLVVGIIAEIVLRFTRRGRYVYALGSNAEGTRRAGINVRATILTVYSISGLLAGLAGIMLTARQSQGDPNAGVGYELDAIAAAVLGGASLFGARGSIVGTFLGVLLVAIIQNGLDLMGVDPQVARMVAGALLIAIVWLDQLRKRYLSLA